MTPQPIRPLRRILAHTRGSDFLRSTIEFLLGAGFLLLALGFSAAYPVATKLAPHVEFWMVYELAAAFLLGLFHLLTYEDRIFPFWGRLAFVATLSFYIVFALRHAWHTVIPLLAAKSFSLWVHGTLTEEEFGYRVLKGMYLAAYLIIGAILFAVLDSLELWPKRDEPPWTLALLIGFYYVGLGLWQVVLEALKRMVD